MPNTLNLIFRKYRWLFFKLVNKMFLAMLQFIAFIVPQNVQFSRIIPLISITAVFVWVCMCVRGCVCAGFPLFCKFQVFSRFLVIYSSFFQGFLCQIPGTFIPILVLKISKCVKTDAVFPLLLWHKIPCIFQVKAMRSNVNLASNQCLCW